MKVLNNKGLIIFYIIVYIVYYYIVYCYFVIIFVDVSIYPKWIFFNFLFEH